MGQYEWSQHVLHAAWCVDQTGKGPRIPGGYDVTLVTRFRVTKANATGRALAFSGTSAVRYLPNALGHAHGCGYFTATERLVGRAITVS